MKARIPRVHIHRSLWAFLLASLPLSSTACADSVEMNVIPTDRSSFGAVQEWAQALAKLRNVRVRSNIKRRAREEVKWEGSTMYITAVIGSRDTLIVPGKRFSIRQVGALQAWIEAQKKAHREGDQQPKDQKFGLSVSELKRVHEMLKPTVDNSTLNINALQSVRAMVQSTALPVRFDAGAKRRLQTATSRTEWQDFSVGTALAGLLREQELVLLPKIRAGRPEFHILPERAAKQAWPVGWPPEAKKQQIVPKLFTPLPIQIYDISIRDAMAAIETRIETPIVFDEGLLSAVELDPDRTKITIKPGRSFYGKVIRQAAFNAKMKSELRTDERGKGFFWITKM